MILTRWASLQTHALSRCRRRLHSLHQRWGWRLDRRLVRQLPLSPTFLQTPIIFFIETGGVVRKFTVDRIVSCARFHGVSHTLYAQLYNGALSTMRVGFYGFYDITCYTLYARLWMWTPPLTDWNSVSVMLPSPSCSLCCIFFRLCAVIGDRWGG